MGNKRNGTLKRLLLIHYSDYLVKNNTNTACPFCSHRPLEEECIHFLGDFDHTFSEVQGDKPLENTAADIRDLLINLFEASSSQELIKSRGLEDLYNSWKDNEEIEGHLFIDFLIKELVKSGAKEPLEVEPSVGDVEEENGFPGFSSHVTILYALSPEEILRETIGRLTSSFKKT